VGELSLKHGLLGLLNQGPMTGYELDKAFKSSLDFFWQAQTSQIYRELTAMEKQGWLSSEIIVQTDKPNKKLYTLTPEGKAELLNWLSENSIEDDIRVRDAFLVKLFFSGEIDNAANIEKMKLFKKACEISLQKMAETEITIADCGRQLEDKHHMVYWGATASFGTYYYEMCIQWAEDTIKKLEDLP
jgi:PadR family transcriptional regulator AphA